MYFKNSLILFRHSHRFSKLRENRTTRKTNYFNTIEDTDSVMVEVEYYHKIIFSSSRVKPRYHRK